MTADIFFSELKKLLSRYPKVPTAIINCENSDYGDYIYHSKNLHICFDCENCVDCLYTYDSYIVANCVDCDYCVQTELSYESVDSVKCFNSDYLEYCVNTRDSFYSFNCLNCNDVFGCVNLSNKSYCIFNRQLSKDEYKEKVVFYKKWLAEKVLAMVEDLRKRYPFTQKEAYNENSFYGNYIHHNKNCYLSFDAAHDEECAYLYDCFYNKTCYDMTYSSQNNQLSYEVVDSTNLFNCNFSVFSDNSHDSSYIFNCSNVKNCIGCVSLSNKQYCILNRQFTREQYEKVSRQLFEELRNKNAAWNDLWF